MNNNKLFPMKNSVKNYITPEIRSYEIVPDGVLCQSPSILEGTESLGDKTGNWGSILDDINN